ncbi:MAG: hypothetical protein ABWK53_04465 [Anaerolineales bacterium]
MNWQRYLLLALAGLGVTALVAAFQPSAGYMDASYYYAGGLQLAHGRGFSEPYLWNYLDDPAGLPHPSHAYWMPLASLLAAAGAALAGPSAWFAARSGFLALAALLPPLTAALAWSFTARRDLALLAGFLAVFSGFYLPFLPVTDTFGLYMLLGGLFFLGVGRPLSVGRAVCLGLLTGLMHLARADGLLWLLLAFLAVLFFMPRPASPSRLLPLGAALGVLLGYLLIMGPWFGRNLLVFGTPLAPGGSKMLWLTSYNQIFAFPADQITFAAWLDSGAAAILRARLWALGMNLATAFGVQGQVFLSPLVLLAVWHLRRERRLQLAALAWLLTLTVMTAVFPFAGARGGFFHAGAALQPVWWALAPLGLERILDWGRRRRGWEARAGAVFRTALAAAAALFTALIVWSRVFGGGAETQAWGRDQVIYRQAARQLQSAGLLPGQVVMVADPPAFYLASGQPAIVIPDGSPQTALLAAERYGARFLILEAGSLPDGLLPLYRLDERPPGILYLGEVDGARLFEFRLEQITPP